MCSNVQERRFGDVTAPEAAWTQATIQLSDPSWSLPLLLNWELSRMRSRVRVPSSPPFLWLIVRGLTAFPW